MSDMQDSIGLWGEPGTYLSEGIGTEEMNRAQIIQQKQMPVPREAMVIGEMRDSSHNPTHLSPRDL